MNHRVLRAKGILMGLIIMISATYSPVMGCTGIFYTDKNLALAGNNEDWMSPFTRIWFLPAKQGKFGRMCLGFQEGGYQGGMNDQGLFFDGFALNPVEVKPVPGKEAYSGDLAQKAMEECRSVEEVISLFEHYDRSGLAGAQLFFADKQGNSAIIEAQAIVRKTGAWQIVTNFRQSQDAPEKTTDPRYCLARQMMETEKKVDVTLFRRIMAATHQEGKYPTQYSNICDLRTGIVHLYRFHNYEQGVQIDLREELKKGRRVIDMQTLFPGSNAATVYKAGIEKAMAERLSKKTIVPLNLEKAALLAGEYAFCEGMMAGYTVTISLQGNKLFTQVNAMMEPSELHPLSETDYLISGLEEVYALKFIRDPAAGSIKLKVSMMGMDVEAIKK